LKKTYLNIDNVKKIKK